jgi:hypothetical protein
MFNAGTLNGYENIQGKIAIISDENNLSKSLLAVKSIKDSELDLYIELKDTTILINDIKGHKGNLTCSDDPVFKYSVSEIFSPFDYNAVICISDNCTMDQIISACKACATPVIYSSASTKTKAA